MGVVTIRHRCLFDCVVISATSREDDFIIIRIFYPVADFFHDVKEAAKGRKIVEGADRRLHLIHVEAFQILFGILAIFIAILPSRPLERCKRMAPLSVPQAPAVTLGEILNAQAIFMCQLLSILERVEADDGTL